MSSRELSPSDCAALDWQDISTAPKDAAVLLYGILDPHPDSVGLYGNLTTPMRAVGYWDEIDDAWCPVGSTWLGPWFEPTHWMPLPAPPSQDGFMDYFKMEGRE